MIVLGLYFKLTKFGYQALRYTCIKYEMTDWKSLINEKIAEIGRRKVRWRFGAAGFQLCSQIIAASSNI